MGALDLAPAASLVVSIYSGVARTVYVCNVFDVPFLSYVWPFTSFGFFIPLFLSGL